jgi:hypothetical protein
MPQRNIQCPNGLRSAVQLNIQSIPAVCCDLIRISGGRFVKSATGIFRRSFSKGRCADRSIASPVSRVAVCNWLTTKELYADRARLRGRLQAVSSCVTATVRPFRGFSCHTY